MEKTNTGPKYNYIKGSWGDFLENILPFILGDSNNYDIFSGAMYEEKGVNPISLFQKNKEAETNLGEISDGVNGSKSNYYDKLYSIDGERMLFPGFFFNRTLKLNDLNEPLGKGDKNTLAVNSFISYMVGGKRESLSAKNVRNNPLADGTYRE